MTNPKPSEVLTLLAERVSEEGRWCTGDTNANDESGCLLWHLAKITGTEFHSYSSRASGYYMDYAALDKLAETQYLAMTAGLRGNDRYTSSVFSFNDNHTQAECVSLAHEAARLAKENGE